MRIKSSILCFLLAGVALQAGAWQRTDAEMLRIARDNFGILTSVGAPRRDVVKLLDKEMLSVYGTEEGGYVVVSRSSLSSSVIGYSDCRFDSSDIPGGLRWWIDLTDHNLAAGEGGAAVDSPESAVEPMLTTKWAQESPYNRLCPSSGGFWGSTPMAGCVSIAMAQILNHFEYPASATGAGAYSIDGGASFKEVEINTVYDWGKMRDSYHFNYSEEEADAVAALVRDCGYASRTIYSAQGSGANLYEAAAGIVKNMKYDPFSLRVHTRAYIADADWNRIVMEELSEGRPILYNAVDPAKLGHAFVFDGMDTQGRVHVNWGWKGDSDGYYDISGLTPSYPDPYTGGTVSYDFSDDQVMVTGFKAQPEPDPEDKYESNFVSYEKPELKFSGDNLMVSSVPVFNYSHLDFNGMLGLVVEGEDGHCVVLPFFYSAWENDIEVPVLGGLYISEEFYGEGTLHETDGKTPRPDGKYLFYFVSWAEEEIEQGTNPCYIRFPMALASDGKTNYGVWEAEIKDGHWDAASLRPHDAPQNPGSVDIAPGAEGGEIRIYNLDGTLIYSGGEYPGSGILGDKPVIVRRNGKSKKIIVAK